MRPQHLAPDDSMILYQILRPCHPSLPSGADPYRVVVSWQDPITGQDRQTEQATTLGQLGIDDGKLSKAAAIVTYAETLKRLKSLTPVERVVALNTAKQTVLDAGASDAELTEIADLIDKLISANQP